MQRHSAYVVSAAGLVVLTAALTHLVLDWRAAERQEAQAQKIAHLAVENKTLRGGLTRLKHAVRELEAALAKGNAHEEQERPGGETQHPYGVSCDDDLPTCRLSSVLGRKSRTLVLVANKFPKRQMPELQLARCLTPLLK